jgi:hypothetical protein
MKKLCDLIYIFSVFVLLLFAFPHFSLASSAIGVIDSSNEYAWSENTGWINFGTTQGNVTVADSELTGYAYSENTGWISLNCSNDNSCVTSNYKVANDGKGVLSGYAYGENVGWIVFDCATSACVKTDWKTLSARSGGGGLPAEAFNLPVTPKDGFKVIINNGASITANNVVTLNFNASTDVKKMAISNSPISEGVALEDYSATKTWTLSAGDGLKTVYVRFFTAYGQRSQTASSSIVLKSSTSCLSYSNVGNQITCFTDIILQLKQQIAKLLSQRHY